MWIARWRTTASTTTSSWRWARTTHASVPAAPARRRRCEANDEYCMPCGRDVLGDGHFERHPGPGARFDVPRPRQGAGSDRAGRVQPPDRGYPAVRGGGTKVGCGSEGANLSQAEPGPGEALQRTDHADGASGGDGAGCAFDPD